MGYKQMSKRMIGAVGIEATGMAYLPHIVAWEGRLEEAVQLLAQALAARPRKGKKPVVVHSLRVAYRLLAMGYCQDVVIAGLLHDLLEKASQAMRTQVVRRFGLEVAHMVQATTNDPHIRDPLRRYSDSVRRCAIYGEGALLVRSADLLDNCERMLVLESGARLGRLADKLRLVLAVGKDQKVDPRMLDELQKCLRKVNRQLSHLALT